MRYHSSLIILALTSGTWSPVFSQTVAYQPLGIWKDSQASAYRNWNMAIKTLANRTLKPEARPQLPGIRSRNVELMEDAFLRKHPKLLKGSRSTARDVMLRAYSTRNGLNRLNGSLAEAIFLDKNPEWGYVKNPNASQHDIYRWVDGRPTPVNGQVKFYEEFSSSRYADAMQKDSRAHRFIVPDDHVEPLKKYLKAKEEEMIRAGNKDEANRYRRDYARVLPIGATSDEIKAERDQAIKEMNTEKRAVYVTFGASLALALAPTIYDWSIGNISGDIGLYRTTRALSILGVGFGTHAILNQIKDGALRGTLKGHLLVGTALTITEGIWALHEHGWRRAFYNPRFYEEIGGGVGAFALATASGTIVGNATIKMSPWVSIPLTIGTGILTGTVGYIGGKVTTHKLLEIFSPDILRQQENQKIFDIKKKLDFTIMQLQLWPPK